jgi:hypothetical protein
MHWEFECMNTQFEEAPNPDLYDVAALTLFPNLQQLFVHMVPLAGTLNALLWLVNRNSGRIIFQQLEQLQVSSATSMPMTLFRTEVNGKAPWSGLKV